MLNKEDLKEEKICCICGDSFSNYGNNPYPYPNIDGSMYDEDAQCCDSCNDEHVNPLKMAKIQKTFMQKREHDLMMKVLKDEYNPALVKKSIEFWSEHFWDTKDEFDSLFENEQGKVKKGETVPILGIDENNTEPLAKIYIEFPSNYLVLCSYRMWQAKENLTYLNELRANNELGVQHPLAGFVPVQFEVAE